MPSLRAALFATAALALALPAFAATDYAIALKSGKFFPNPLTVPANQKFTLKVTNQDSTASEFESSDFNREEIIKPGETVPVIVGPLAPGSYGYFDDYDRNATGTLIAK
jgi:hypothetical protein